MAAGGSAAARTAPKTPPPHPLPPPPPAAHAHTCGRTPPPRLPQSPAAAAGPCAGQFGDTANREWHAVCQGSKAVTSRGSLEPCGPCGRTPAGPAPPAQVWEGGLEVCKGGPDAQQLLVHRQREVDVQNDGVVDGQPQHCPHQRILVLGLQRGGAEPVGACQLAAGRGGGGGGGGGREGRGGRGGGGRRRGTAGHSRQRLPQRGYPQQRHAPHQKGPLSAPPTHRPAATTHAAAPASLVCEHGVLWPE